MSDRREEILSTKLMFGSKDGFMVRVFDVKDAMDEYRDEECLRLIQWMIDKGMFPIRVVNEVTLLYYRGEYITKESLFRFFL